MTTTMISSEQAASERGWVLVDAAGQTVGRLASQVSAILRGKNKVNFTPHMDTGDFVVVINCSQVRFTGKKLLQKKYYDYSGYVGGLKETSAQALMDKNPCNVVERAVKGMIPHGPLGYKLMKKLKTFSGADHTHASQLSAGKGSKKAAPTAAAS
jgi:large subunit ribosomal protein L13